MRKIFFGGAALSALTIAMGTATAQTPGSAPAPTVDTVAPAADQEGSKDVVVITGSRLRQESFDSPNPTLEIGAQEIDDRQVANAVDVIEDLPLVGIGTNNRGTQVQNGDSFAFPDVLDLGTQRTLTLLNGRRVVATNPGSVFVPGNASGSQVDLSVFSPQIIKRVDVLAGTGGAIYGADAVGGVVNLITKDDFEGLDLRAQAGVTEIGDGEQYRLSGTWGSDLLDGRAHLMVSGDYFHQERIGATADREVRYGGTGIANALEGSVRNTAAFSAANAVTTLLGGGALASPFLPQASDGVGSTFFGPMSLQNPLVSAGGSLLTAGIYGAGFSGTTNLIPATTIHPSLAGINAGPNGLPFFAPTALTGSSLTSAAIIGQLAPGVVTTGLTTAQIDALALQLVQRNRPTPYEYFQQNPSVNPLLFAGTFGTRRPDTGALNAANGAFPTITNTDPATSAIFPRVAVPLAFDASGNLVPLTLGNLVPASQGRLGQTFGGGGYDAFADGHSQVQAGTDRIALAAISSFDISETLRWKSQIMYTNAEFSQTGGAVTQSPGGSAQSGALAVPIYINQNPYVTTAARNQILGLQTGTSGFTIPTLNGQQVMYLGRAMTDLTGGGISSTLEVENFMITEILEGDFSLNTMDFYWDVAAGWGRSDQVSKRPDYLDTEFALAVDVVNGPNGPVCRQQTLAAPEPITVRNPGTSGIVQTVGLTPTVAQVQACKPLNLLGPGLASAEAIDYVLGNADVHGLNSLMYYSGSLGGDIFKLPGGMFSLGVQAEHREESAEFEPSRDTQLGLGRIAPQGRGEGTIQLDEYGFEAHLPVFGDDFQLPLLRALDFSYALRIVERSQESSTVLFSGEGTEDDTFNYSVRWKPLDDLTFRAAKARTVRSASLVELVGPFTVAFTALNANTNPCVTSAIGTGPNPAVRRANCISAVQALGIASNPTDAATFLSTFVGTAGTRPANAGGNPGLVNEEGNNYTLGVTWEPSFVPNLVLAADFFSVDLTNEIGLVGPGDMVPGCFDSPNYPNTILGGAPACELFLFGTPTGPGGQFVIPANNAITGNPGGAGVLAGSPAFAQTQFELAFAAFSNLNLGKREFRGVNVEARYNFDFADVPGIGESIANWGEMFLRTSYFQTQRYDIFGDGVNLTDRLAGEHTNAEHEVRTDIRHKIGPFDHTLQWFWNSATVTNVLTAKGIYAEQTPSFRAKAFNYFNYAASYELNETFKLQFVVNNLFDTQDPRGIYGLTNQYDGGIGREFIFGVNARF
jgi:iron complex outermembrane recepter protein